MFVVFENNRRHAKKFWVIFDLCCATFSISVFTYNGNSCIEILFLIKCDINGVGYDKNKLAAFCHRHGLEGWYVQTGVLIVLSTTLILQH